MTAFTDADIAYLRAGYTTLERLCAGRRETPAEVADLIDRGLLPRPFYELEDGTGLFPADYFRLVDDAGGPHRLRAEFARRHRSATRAAARAADTLEPDWEAYLAGAYGVCLREVTPKAIVRKGVLVSAVCELLVLARPGSGAWRAELRAAVEELDELERAFTPDHDRSPAQERAPTRDLLVTAARARHPQAFAGAEAE